ncbi:MAG: phenylacetate--CoA ligase family protein, partial [Deltaproteobacteria bacterium]|nr:phenylacetate--CoA ligase family protein [Deltaproteobacteria bacterium]
GADVVVHPQAFREVLLRDPGIASYQVRQVPAGAHVAIVSCGAIDHGKLHGGLVAALEKAGVREPQVTVSLVDELAGEQTRKVRRFVPEGGVP